MHRTEENRQQPRTKNYSSPWWCPAFWDDGVENSERATLVGDTVNSMTSNSKGNGVYIPEAYEVLGVLERNNHRRRRVPPP